MPSTLPPAIPIIGGVVFALIALVWFTSLLERQNIRRLEERGLWPRPGETPTLDHVNRLAMAGQKILAIKLYRQTYSVGLKEAKDAVDRMCSGLPPR